MSLKITRRRLLAAGAAATTLPMLGNRAGAQASWPNKSIKIIVPFPAGGQTDQIARVYGDYIRRQVGQPVIIENKAGAGGTLGAVEVKRSAPDGYTLMLAIGATFINNRLTIKNLPYDPDKDFTLISAILSEGLPFVASAKTGAENLKQFIEYAKKTPKVNVGSFAVGSLAHATIVELNKKFGTKIEPVHYRGEPPMWTDVLSGSIDGAIGSYPGSLPVLQSGKGKVIGAMSRPITALPNVQTLSQQGVTSKLFDLALFAGLFAAPAGTPIEIIRKLSDLMVAGGQDEKTKASLANVPVYPPLGYEAAQKRFKDEAPISLQILGGLGLTAE